MHSRPGWPYATLKILRLHPDAIEFWQGRDNRLHDRFRYLGEPSGGWRIELPASNVPWLADVLRHLP